MTTDTAPSWLLQSQAGLCPCGCIGRRKKGGFVEKTISGASGLLRQAMFSEDMAARPGLLQRIEPRLKLLGILGLLMAAALVQHIEILLALYALTLVLAAASRLSLSFFIKRVWLFIPIFTGVIVLPATFSFITPGEIVVPFGTWFGHPVGMTSQGLTSAGLIVSRVAVSISLVVLLTLSTPWNRLLGALRSLAVPRMFVLVLAMTYRYVFHLLGSVTDMYVARRARTVGVQSDVTSGRAFVAASAGALFGKSHALAEEVHMAMLARGYNGNVRTLTPAKVTPRDVAWLAGSALIAVCVIGADLALR
ncbi:MAG TPA: cobalt ECF transporter T component CbiQ [Acidimicrobiales bacterium]